MAPKKDKTPAAPAPASPKRQNQPSKTAPAQAPATKFPPLVQVLRKNWLESDSKEAILPGETLGELWKNGPGTSYDDAVEQKLAKDIANAYKVHLRFQSLTADVKFQQLQGMVGHT